jgi:MobA/MobL family protein
MGLYRFSVKHLGRLTARAPVAQHVAYILREDDYAPAQAHLHYLFRESAPTRQREDLVHKEWHNLPAWAAHSPATFFAAAEQYERANGRFATTWEIALPRELPRAAQLETVRAFLQTQFGERQPYAWAMHESPASDGGTNPHVHVLFSSRTLDGVARDASQFFRRYHPEQPAQGGAQKDPWFRERRSVGASRQAWADVANWSLERAGVDARIDPRSLADRGIDRPPEPRVDPYHSTQAKYHHRLTPTWAHTLAAREARTPQHAQEQGHAQAAWEARKQALGLTAAMPQEAMMLRVTQGMQEARATRPERLTVESLTQQLAQQQHTLQTLEQHHARLHGTVMIFEHHRRHGLPLSDREVQRADALLRDGATLGLAVLDNDVSLGRGVRVRFQPDRGQGYGW